MKILPLYNDIYQIWDDKEENCYFQGSILECELYLENNRGLTRKAQLTDCLEEILELLEGDGVPNLNWIKNKIKETLNK